jgi:hypothetical protein
MDAAKYINLHCCRLHSAGHFQPITAHWGAPNPAAATGTSQGIDRAFSKA